MIQIILTVIFGFVWWLAFNLVGPGLSYLMILGSVLAVCVCCCKGGEFSLKFNFQHYLACIRRCWLATVILMVSLIILGVIVVLVTGGGLSGIVLIHILVAAIGAPLLIRLICCAYDS
jgi:hypothetical protein